MVSGAEKVLAQIAREDAQVIHLLREGIAYNTVRARLVTLQRQKDNVQRAQTVAERAIAERAKTAAQAAGLEEQLRELRVAVKHADTFEKQDAIIAALVPEVGPFAILHTDPASP